MDQTALTTYLITKDESINGSAMLVYMTEGKETPHFLSIFHGRMIIFVDEYRDTIPSRFLLHVTGNRRYNTEAKQVKDNKISLELTKCSDSGIAIRGREGGGRVKKEDV